MGCLGGENFLFGIGYIKFDGGIGIGNFPFWIAYVRIDETTRIKISFFGQLIKGLMGNIG